jgi:hypothetical protein
MGRRKMCVQVVRLCDSFGCQGQRPRTSFQRSWQHCNTVGGRPARERFSLTQMSHLQYRARCLPALRSQYRASRLTARQSLEAVVAASPQIRFEREGSCHIQ